MNSVGDTKVPECLNYLMEVSMSLEGEVEGSQRSQSLVTTVNDFMSGLYWIDIEGTLS